MSGISDVVRQWRYGVHISGRDYCRSCIRYDWRCFACAEALQQSQTQCVHHVGNRSICTWTSVLSGGDRAQYDGHTARKPDLAWRFTCRFGCVVWIWNDQTVAGAESWIRQAQGRGILLWFIDRVYAVHRDTHGDYINCTERMGVFLYRSGDRQPLVCYIRFIAV